MRLLHLALFSAILLCRSANADGNSSNSNRDAIASALQMANLTFLADVGKDIIDGLVNSNQSSGLNYTLLAPNNAAFGNQTDDVSNQLSEILRYHTLPGNFLNTSSTSETSIDAAIMPLVTVGRTLLTDSKYVHLEGGKAQVVVWTKNGTLVYNQAAQGQPDGRIHFLNQSPEVVIVNTTTLVLTSNTSTHGGYQRTLVIAAISGILSPPPDLSQILASSSNNLTSFSGLLDIVGATEGHNMSDLGGENGNGGKGGGGGSGLDGADGTDGADGEDGSDGSNNTTNNGLNGPSVKQLLGSTRHTHGFTLFAPNDEAIKIAGSTTLASLVNNQTALKVLVGNHYINGTSYYSPELVSSSSSDTSFISASGQIFTFNQNATGTYVTCGTSGNRADGMEAAASNARIVRTDLLLSNGVIHVIDRVLVNLDADERKAEDAYKSAVSKAQTESTSTPTGPIEPLSTDSSSSSAGANNENSAQGVSPSSIFSLSLASLPSLFGQWYWWSTLRWRREEFEGLKDKGWNVPGWGWGAVAGGVLVGGLGVGIVGL